MGISGRVSRSCHGSENLRHPCVHGQTGSGSCGSIRQAPFWSEVRNCPEAWLDTVTTKKKHGNWSFLLCLFILRVLRAANDGCRLDLSSPGIQKGKSCWDGLLSPPPPQLGHFREIFSCNGAGESVSPHGMRMSGGCIEDAAGLRSFPFFSLSWHRITHRYIVPT